MVQVDTRQSILDAAEELFSRKGFQGASLRAITRQADVNLAAVNYHFGSKEALVEEVLQRRLVPLNKTRVERIQQVLAAAETKGRRPQARDLIFAFMQPTILFRESDPGIPVFISLVGRGFVESDSTVRNLFMELMKPVFMLMMASLHHALPHIPENILYWRIRFMMGAMSHTMQSIGNCPMEINENVKNQDARDLVEILIPFLTAGMEAPV